MRRRSIASLFVLLASSVFVVALGGAASASALPVNGGCTAYAEPPHLVVNSSRLWATGTYQCATAYSGMTITTCIEEGSPVTGTEWVRGCSPTVTEGEATDKVIATASVSIPVYATYLRTHVHGTNAAGYTVDFYTPWVFWFNCACYIG